MTSIACIIIACEKRRGLLDEHVVPSVVQQGFDEVVVVGPYHSGGGYRHLPFPPITDSTIDAQLKRDVGTSATSSEWLVYLSDDHKLCADFTTMLAATPLFYPGGETVIGVPERYCWHGGRRVRLNMGLPEYCGGHAGVFHRSAIQTVPWSVAPHHRNWDVLHTQMLTGRGYQLVELADCMIEDLEPQSQPWR